MERIAAGSECKLVNPKFEQGISISLDTSEGLHPKIAHIDWNSEMREVIIKELQKHSFVVNGYDSAKSFLPVFKVGLFDVIIFDTWRTGGFDLFRHIKRIDPKQKFVYLTAFEIYYDEFKKLFPDIDCPFLKKPISITNLVTEINKTLGIDVSKAK